jgi:hypothetical protein
MRVVSKLIIATVATVLVAGAAAAATGILPATASDSAFRLSNLILLLAGLAMVGLAAGTGKATSAIGRRGFRPEGQGSLLLGWLPRRAPRLA